MTIRTRIRTRARTQVLAATGGTVLLVGVLSGCGGTDVEDAPVEHKSFAYSGKALTIEAENSTVEVVPADVEQIEVTRRVDGWVVLGSGPDPVWKLEGDTLTLRVRCDALISDCGAQHQVKVPRGLGLTVDADNGKVTASGFGTPLKLHSDNGGVVVRDVTGPLELESDNGSVRGERISAASVVARSDNGSVELGFSRVPDLVDTVSDNGRVTIDLPAGKSAYAVSASADNGDVSVAVPRSDDSPHTVKARSDNGQVTVRSAN
ncbi:hypothetical protein E6R60_04305 [Streptomyces sp. A0642]|uniref:DUF4097 family beta strand repeat-containing protein n=1 Tax=Streptomyces sp. A0642 TaxID=2563100 RepID=UPI0010A2610F|nr:DUF4097 family beta strand repeat-containing protein [Streptomyces sp. A0642]THA78133.1 hypothetical protein E6R60_04305 [Streptomyces sp. A0642]